MREIARLVILSIDIPVKKKKNRAFYRGQRNLYTIRLYFDRGNDFRTRLFV